MQPLIQDITQIGIVTSDVTQMMAHYRQLGITEWTLIDGKKGFDSALKARDLQVDGKPQDFEITLATAQVGSVEIELIEPLDNKSDYARFLREHGEGVHHISVVTDVPAYQAAMQARGVPVLMQGTVPGVETFTYYDTRAVLGATTEIHDTEHC